MKQETMMQRRNSTQSGMVSILTVLFFMVFISILVVSFIRLISNEQRQATDNDLSASALAAAQNGIEDAKRIIMYCTKDSPTGANTLACTDLMSSGDAANGCSVLSGGGNMNSLRNSLKIGDLAANGDVIISTDGSATFQQYYSCLTISQDTPFIKKSVAEGSSMITKLTTLTPFDTLEVSWTPDRGTSSSYDVSSSVALNMFKPVANWKNANPFPPVLRLQFIPYLEGANIDLDAAESGSRTLFVVPTSASSGADGIGVDANRGSPGLQRTNTGVPIVFATCTGGTGYACTKVVNGFDTAASRRYYLRASLLYSNDKSAEVTIKPKVGGVDTKFKNVQPVIDVTGRANDVFRRVRAYVSFAAPILATPEYAVETASPICKNIVVADAANSQYSCP